MADDKDGDDKDKADKDKTGDTGARKIPIEKMPRIYQLLDGEDPHAVLAGLTPREARAILDNWQLWALPHQMMPPGKWRRWMLLGGRGIGKTLTTNKTAHVVAADKDSLGGGIIGILALTHTDVRLVNVEDPSTGILATAPEGFRPTWKPGPGVLRWPNGVVGRVFSAESIESIRGNNIAFMIADEIAAYPDGERSWWEVVELAVRVGRAQIAISTTPKPLEWLRNLAADEGTVVTRATTYDNPFLEPDVRARYERAYAGTRRERQELLGEFLEDVQGALVRDEAFISDNRVSVAPELERVVVAVDPAITAHKRSDETGIVVFGVDRHGHGFVLEDATGKYGISSNEWAQAVVRLYREHEADMVVGEVNRGGDMVEAGLRSVARDVPFAPVKATRGKIIRAQPLGSLYEQGRIHHVGTTRAEIEALRPLENELLTWVPGDKSPNRLDALVWAATHTLIDNSTAIDNTSSALDYF